MTCRRSSIASAGTCRPTIRWSRRTMRSSAASLPRPSGSARGRVAGAAEDSPDIRFRAPTTKVAGASHLNYNFPLGMRAGWWRMSSRLEKLCAEKGLKMTEQRRVIARVLSEAADHPDAEELYRRSSSIDPHISIATVYRTVKLFEDAGILERHDFRDGRSRYEEISEHHDHLIDLSTGRVIEFVNEEI